MNTNVIIPTTTDEQARALIDHDLCELEGPGSAVINRGELMPLVEMLKKRVDAATTNSAPKRPRLSDRFMHPITCRVGPTSSAFDSLNEHGHSLTLCLAKPHSRNPGYVYVCDENGGYHGKISPEGIFVPSLSGADDYILPMLQFTSRTPLQSAIGYGRITRKCAFCGRALSTKESRRLGYGPVCVITWGLATPQSVPDTTPTLL